jgi:hypothetical protein
LTGAESIQIKSGNGIRDPKVITSKLPCRELSSVADVDLPQYFDLLDATIADATTAIVIILVMSLDVVAPKIIIDCFGGGSTPE